MIETKKRLSPIGYNKNDFRPLPSQLPCESQPPKKSLTYRSGKLHLRWLPHLKAIKQEPQKESHCIRCSCSANGMSISKKHVSEVKGKSKSPYIRRQSQITQLNYNKVTDLFSRHGILTSCTSVSASIQRLTLLKSMQTQL